LSGIRALTLELQHGSEIPPQPGYYVAYDGWQSPFAAWFGPIPERDPRSGGLRWPQTPQQSEH